MSKQTRYVEDCYAFTTKHVRWARERANNQVSVLWGNPQNPIFSMQVQLRVNTAGGPEEAPFDAAILQYENRHGQERTQTVFLFPRQSNLRHSSDFFEGTVYYVFQCSGLGNIDCETPQKRRRKLYYPPNITPGNRAQFACRNCHDLLYTSQKK